MEDKAIDFTPRATNVLSLSNAPYPVSARPHLHHR